MPSYLFRPARAEDKAAVKALSAQIWEGQDYVGDAFDDWLADPEGQFTVVYDGDTLVACSKLTRMGPAEWWLEGLRVDPAYQGRGLGRAIHHFDVALAEELGSGTLRFVTGNPLIHKLADETDFRPVGPFVRLLAEPLPPAGPLPFLPATPADRPAIRDWVAHSPWWQAAAGLMEDDWQWFELEPRWESLLAAERVYWYAPAGTRTALLVCVQEGQELLRINYLDVQPGWLDRLLKSLREMGGWRGVQTITARLPQPQLAQEGEQVLFTAGWQLENDSPLWVYERPL